MRIRSYHFHHAINMNSKLTTNPTKYNNLTFLVPNIFYAVKTHDSLEDRLYNMIMQICDSILFLPYHSIIIFISYLHDFMTFPHPAFSTRDLPRGMHVLLIGLIGHGRRGPYTRYTTHGLFISFPPVSHRPPWTDTAR